VTTRRILDKRRTLLFIVGFFNIRVTYDDKGRSVADDTNDEVKRPKRRLQASTETVRERTEKLQTEAAKPKSPSKFRSFWGGFFWPLRALGRQIAKLNRFRVFRWIGYVLLPPYIRNSWRELKLVTWPDRRESISLSYAVIVFSLIFGVVVFALDSV
jgi:preprotein translocase SecE subunit